MSASTHAYALPNAAWRSRIHSILPLFCIGFFVALAIWGSPNKYVDSGRAAYLIPVLSSADPGLFPDDYMIEPLSRFGSAFYSLLSSAFDVLRLPPQSLEGVLYWVRVVTKVSLILLLFGLSSMLSRSIWLFVLLAAWASHEKLSPISGHGLFDSFVTHEEVAFVIGLGALYCAFTQRRLPFWILLALSLLVHPVVSIFLFLCVVPPLFWRGVSRLDVPGLALFALSCGIYLYTSAPALSAEDLSFIWQMKSRMVNVSPLAQVPVNWIRMLLLVALAVLAHRYILRDHKQSGLLVGSVLSGAAFGLLMSAAMIVFDSPTLGRLNPMRIFVWVTFFTYVTIALAGIQAFRRDRFLGPILFGLIILTIIDSLWVFAFLSLCVGYLGFRQIPHLSRIVGSRQSEILAHGLMVLIVLSMFAAWALGDRQPSESFRNPIPLAVGVALLALQFWPSVLSAYRPVVLVALLAYSLAAASLHAYEVYGKGLDPDWELVRRWSQEHTAKSDRFITPPEAGNFRVLSLRTSLNEGFGMIVWVSPATYRLNEHYMGRVSDGQRAGRWDLRYLSGQAQEWNAQYVIIKGGYAPESAIPVFTAGEYAVIRVPIETPSGRE